MDNYTNQLRTDSIFLVIPLAVVLPLCISVGLYSFNLTATGLVAEAAAPGQFTPIIIFVLNILLPLILASVCWQLAKKDRAQLAGRLLVGGLLAILGCNFLLFWTPSAFLAISFAFVILISSTLISPGAGLTVWMLSTLIMMSALVVNGQLSAASIATLLPAVVINLLIAGASFATTYDWDRAVNETYETQLRAQRRRDELFTVQQELERTTIKQASINRQFATSVSVGQKVVAMIDLDQLLDQVADVIQRQLGYGYVAIFLVDNEQERLELQAQSKKYRSAKPTEPYLPLTAPGSISQAAQLHGSIIINDIAASSLPRHTYLQSNTAAEVALPLKTGVDDLLGILNIQSHVAGTFDDDHMLIVESLAGQVAIAIQNARLFHQQSLRYRLTETISDIGRALSQTLDLEEVLALILSHLADIVSYDRAAIFLHREDIMEMVASQGFRESEQNLQIDIDDDDDIFIQMVRSRKPLAIPNVDEYPLWRQPLKRTRTRSWLGVPLIHDGNVTGMLSLARTTLSPYSQDEVELALGFAAQAAIALHNANLYSQVARFNQHLESEVKQRTAAITEAYARLEKLDQAKSDFLNVASHELRTPLTIIRGYSEMMLSDPDVQESRFQAKMTTGIHNAALRLHDIVDDMLDVMKIDNEELQLYHEPTSVHQLVRAAAQKYEAILGERHIDLHLDEKLGALPEIQADRDSLEKALRHLLTNAIKFTPDSGHIVVSGRPLAADQDERLPAGMSGIQLMIKDTGIGVDPHDQELIFSKFYQTGEVNMHSSGRTKFKGGGPGLGLAIAKGIIDAHEGFIWVDSPGQDEDSYPGSTFHIVLPQKPQYSNLFLPTDSLDDTIDLLRNG